MSWDWQQGGPVSYDNSQYYNSAQNDDKRTLAMAEHSGGGVLEGIGEEEGEGQEHILGRQNSFSNTNPTNTHTNGSTPALGFYPNPTHTLPTHMTEQFFPQPYSNIPSTSYRPSPLHNGPDGMLDANYGHLHSNGNGGDPTAAGLDYSGLDQVLPGYQDFSVPPPRFHSEPHAHYQPHPQYLQQQLHEYSMSSNGHGNGNGNGHLLHSSNGSLSLETATSDALTQYLSNPASYSAYHSLPHAGQPYSQSQAQGTISPSQLGSAFNINKHFSSLMMSRGSSSSASSTEGGHDFTGTATPALGLEDQGTSSLSGLAYPTMGHFPSTTLDPSHSDTSAAVREYLTCPNRLEYGERILVISTPKVGQKSYGNEKRFLCPHPQATLYGSSWWTAQGDTAPTAPVLPPRVNISLSGEEAIKDATVSWTNSNNQSLDDRINVEAIYKQEQPFVGNVAGRFLHVSDNEGKRSNFTALVRIRAPSSNAIQNVTAGYKGALGAEASEIIGSFESKEIKIISKPSKKKTNTKSTELVITHGSTIALYNRTKSQTASTRYLNIESDLTNIRGSDGQHIPRARPKPPPSKIDPSDIPGLVSSASVWESFIIWLADPTKPAGPSGLAPLQPGWPSQPMNAMITGPIPPPIRYNAMVILQSIQSGKCTPIMIIRRIDQDSDAVGQDGTVTDLSLGHAPEGELLGDMVAQVQKVAMEMYDPILAGGRAHNPTSGDSRWLACDHDTVMANYVHSERRWAPIPIPYRGGKSHSTPTTPIRGFHILPMTPHTTSTNLPSTPSSPVSSGSSIDYFGINSRKSSSTHLLSPNSSIGESLPMVSTDGGPLRRPRTGSTGRMGPLGRPAHKKRQSQDSRSASASSSYDHLPNALGILEQRQSWSLSVGDIAVWTIVGTEQVTYTFYVPPNVSVSDHPIAPFPTVTKYLPPGADKHDRRTEVGFTPQTNLPLVHLYGKGFSKLADGPKYDVYYGDQKARHVEARCEECMAVSEPIPGTQLPLPITLVRKDGRCVIPTGLTYDHPPYVPLGHGHGSSHPHQQQQHQSQSSQAHQRHYN